MPTSGQSRDWFPRPALTVDLVVVSRSVPRRVLLIRRRNEPFAGRWALPGGFVDENEPLEHAAQRELREETGVDASELIQLGAFGDPGRDPRGWTVTVAYLACIDPSIARLTAGDDAAEARWFFWDQLPDLAFDHDKILRAAQSRISQLVSGSAGTGEDLA